MVQTLLHLIHLVRCVNIVNARENYCPHSAQSNWKGWHCRQNSMTFKGDVDNLKSIDFQAINDANKTILRIYVTNREMSDIPPNILHPLQSLKQLDLHLNTTTLTPHIFDRLTQLEHLSIYSYQERVPQNLFSHLANLKYLKLYIRPKRTRLKPQQRRCQRKEARVLDEIITTQLFRSLKQLKYLSITCSCEYIPSDMLRYQSQLNTLILSINASIIPNNLFHGMYDLTSLFIKSRQQNIILPHRLFYHLRSLHTLEIEAKSVYLPPTIFQYTNNLQMLSFHAIIENIDSNLFTSLAQLYWLDLGSTGIDSLPHGLIHNNTELRHLRLESNHIQNIPPDFFKHSQKLTSLILDHNEIESLSHDTFRSLISLNDIHLQNNRKFAMYCDLGLGDRSLFPHLRAIFMDGMAHKCIPLWAAQLKQNRADLEIHADEEHHPLELCRRIQIDPLPHSVQHNASLLIQFKKQSLSHSNLFIGHAAYWISNAVNSCSDFRKTSNFNADEIGHEEVAIYDNGQREFVFGKKGKYYLVYKYGENAHFMPYEEYVIDVL